MSCNGCRVLRKGCSDSCILRPCLQWIETPEAQGNATVFVAKFFGRAGLMSFISAVPNNQRPALFQSLLFEACGRTINPVNGAVGLLGMGNWHVCQKAVETVLRGGMLRPLPEFLGGGGGGVRSSTLLDSNDLGVQSDHHSSRDPYFMRSKAVSKRKKHGFEDVAVKLEASDLNLSLTSSGVVLVPNKVSKLGSSSVFNQLRTEKQRPTTPSSQESGTTSLDDSSAAVGVARDVHSSANRGETKLLRLFV